MKPWRIRDVKEQADRAMADWHRQYDGVLNDPTIRFNKFDDMDGKGPYDTPGKMWARFEASDRGHTAMREILGLNVRPWCTEHDGDAECVVVLSSGEVEVCETCLAAMLVAVGTPPAPERP
jgi:hypothetical protein